MTQIEGPAASSNDMPNSPSDLTRIYRTIDGLIEAKNTGQAADALVAVPEPANLIYFIGHVTLITHTFKLVLPQVTPQSNQPTDWSLICSRSIQSFHTKYSHPQSSLLFEFNFSKIGNRISIAALASEHERLSTLDISISEYIDSSKFPLSLEQDLRRHSTGFRSSSHLLNFVSLFVNQILHQLLPDLIPRVTIQPSTASPDHPETAEFEPDRSLRSRNVPPIRFTNRLEIGRSDLDPIGTSNFRIPSIYNGPANIFPNQPATGMMVGPTHPIFDHRDPSRSPFGPFGGDGFLPPGAVPPGARFDPIVPGDPLGGLGQGLPLRHFHPGRNAPRGEFNEFRPPSGSSGHDMFM